MILIHDKSYCKNKDLVAHGYAMEDLHCLRFEYQLTDTEISDDYVSATSLDKSDWDAWCKKAFVVRNSAMHQIADALNKAFRLYQYNKSSVVPYKSCNWDLFFWCNTKEGEPDYSYFTLTFNQYMTAEQRQDVCNRVLDFLAESYSDNEHLKVAVQYRDTVFEEKLAKDAQSVIPFIVGKKTIYAAMDGRIVQTERGVFFAKKYARTRGFRLSDADILRIYWKLEET